MQTPMRNYEKDLSKRGKYLIIYDNNIYNMDTLNNQKQRWRCKCRPCIGPIFTDSNENIVDIKPHDAHKSMISDIKKIMIRKLINERAISTNEQSSDLIIKKLSENKDVMPEKLPRLRSMVDSIRKIRNKEMGISIENIDDIPECLKKDDDGNYFLRYDSGVNDTNRFIIFFFKI